MNLNSLPCNFPSDDQDLHHHHPNFAPNYHSQPCVSFHMFFSSAQDQLGCYDHYQQPFHPNHQSDDNFCYNQGGSSAPEIKSNIETGLKLTLWKNDDSGHGDHNQTTDRNPKRMSSNMKVMQKIKDSENHTPSKITNSVTDNLEDQKFQLSCTDLSSGNNSSSYNHSPIRVCADCNTTKTPLWRSGPNGPKSLCNACGIRQRKARRALAAAAAASTDQAPAMKIKVPHKDNKGKIKGQVKKRRKTTSVATGNSDRSPPNNGQNKLRFEEFLLNLSKKLSFHRKFPEDEKDAAILLMAISSGLVHG